MSYLAEHIGDEDRVPVPRQPEAWIRCERCAVFALLPGVLVVLRVARRRELDHCYVSRVERVRGGLVWHVPEGSLVASTFRVSELVGAALLAKHGHQEMQLVRARQRRGEPARTLPATHQKELDKLQRERERLHRRCTPRRITPVEKRTEA